MAEIQPLVVNVTQNFSKGFPKTVFSTFTVLISSELFKNG